MAIGTYLWLHTVFICAECVFSSITVRELDLSFTGNSPRIGTGTITAELFTNRPGVQIVCFLRRTNFRQDCKPMTST